MARQREAQAAYFVSNLHELTSGDLLVCDWENTPGGHASVADAANFIAEVKRLKPNYRTGLYCNKSDWLSTAVKRGDFLWLAHYTDKTDVTGWDFWQYTDKPIDQNRARFATVAEMLEWAIPSPAVQPDPGLFWSDTWQSPYLAFGGASKWATPTRQRDSDCVCQGQRLGLGAHRARWAPTRDRASRLRHTWASASVISRSMATARPRSGNSAQHSAGPVSGHFHVATAAIRGPTRSIFTMALGSRTRTPRRVCRGRFESRRPAVTGSKGSGKYNGPTYAKLDRWKGSPYNPANAKPDVGKYLVSFGQTHRLHRRREAGASAVQGVHRPSRAGSRAFWPAKYRDRDADLLQQGISREN